ncbi:MAG: rod-binding protein [Desulfobulbaceae bacterium]|nr:rod-binding protein [Desulfobulbaceae bacterium]HIJ78604.1 flagellar biosynthesis protein FlgJ [Deltaproteobacteria bacterium]
MNIITDATAGLKGIANSADTPKERKLREACAGFEAIMINQMLSLARRSAPEGGLIEGGYGEEMFKSMQDDQLAQKMAAGNAMGFGEMLYRQLSQTLNTSSK